MDKDSSEFLAQAVGRNLGAVLSLPSAGMLRHHKSRFLGDCAEGLWIESAAQDHSLIDDLIARQQPAAVSFKMGIGKASFAAIPLKRDPQFRINADTVVDALLLRRPEEIKSVQRRNDYRVRVTADSDVSARLWRIGEQAELNRKLPEAVRLDAELRDLSIGGLGVLVKPKDDEPIKLTTDQRLRVELCYTDQCILLEGRVRFLPPNVKDGKSAIRVGVQFKKLDSDINGRQTLATLTRIVGQLQREEVRRMRLGLTAPT